MPTTAASEDTARNSNREKPAGDTKDYSAVILMMANLLMSALRCGLTVSNKIEFGYYLVLFEWLRIKRPDRVFYSLTFVNICIQCCFVQ